jgi:hypothetical protein
MCHPHVMVMLRVPLIVALALVLAVSASPALAAGADDSAINIMVPEKGAPAKKKPHKTRRRGSSNPVYPIPLPRPQAPLAVPQIRNARPHTTTPPPLYVPQTGRLVPNQPAVGSGVGGRETFQDRAARCVNQAGVNSVTAGDRSGYIRGCVNQ